MSVTDKLRARKMKPVGSNTTNRSTDKGSITTEEKPLGKQSGKKGSNTTEKKDRENKFGNLLKEMQSQLALFNDRISALEQRPAQTPPTFAITEELVLEYSQWILAQDPNLVPKTVKNAIVKNYRRPAEDYVRLFQTFLKTRKSEA